MKALVLVLFISGMSQELQPRRKLQGHQGCPFPAREQLCPPDFHLKGLESKGEQSTRGQCKLFSHSNTQLCLSEQKTFILGKTEEKGICPGSGITF